MASAKRLIEVRHSWRSSRRMAEIRVPAWPMPIHQTKLMMSKPQPTGTLGPQTPIPLKSRKATATSRSWRRAKPAAKPSHHPRGVLRWRTMVLILSVTVPKVWPGPTIGCSMRGELGMTGHLGVGVADRGQVGGAGPGLQLGQEPVVAGALLELRHRATGIVHVSEDDGFRRAGLLAGGLDLAFPDGPPLVPGVDAGSADPLHAVGALLHDPAAAHGHVGVAHHLESGGGPVLVQEEVEAPHLVGAVVRAVARPHAAVVDHVVEPLLAVHGGGHRAHHLAGGVLAVHAEDGLVEGLRALRGTSVIAVHPDPVHLAAAGDLVLPHHGDVVLGDARGDAGVAAHAGAQVDGHPPGVPLVLVRGIHGEAGLRLLAHLAEDARM